MIIRHFVVAVLLTSAAALAQSSQPPASQPSGPPPKPGTPAAAPAQTPPDTKAPAPAPAQPAPGSKTPANSPSQPPPQKPGAGPAAGVPNRAAAYYHYDLGHYYEEMILTYGRSEFLNNAIEEYKQAIAADPTSQFLNAALAELYAHSGRLRDAVTEAQDVLRRDPDNLQAHKLLANIYVRALGDIQNGSQSREMLRLSIEQFEQIVRLEPNLADNHLMLGRLYHANNEMAKAESEFKLATRIDPGFDDPNGATVELANLYTDEGNTQRAVNTLNSVPEGARTSKTYMALANAYQQQGDHKHAIQNYHQAVELDRDNLDAHRGLASSLLSDGQTDAALAEYRTIAEADRQDAQAYTRMADIYRRNGHFEEALDSLSKAEAVSSDSVEVPYIRAQVFEAQGRYDEAIALLQGLVQKTTKPAGNYSPGDQNNRAIFIERLGAVYREANKPQQAIETFRTMMELGPEGAARGYDAIIETYRDTKQYQQATAAAREAVQKLPDNRLLQLAYAGQLADTGHVDEGLAQAKALLKGTPADREIWLGIAQIDQRVKRWKDAEEAVAKANQLSNKPEERQIADFMLASLYERQKKFDDAEQVFKKLLAIDPQNGMVLNYYGYMLADRGVRLEEALAYIKKAVAMEPQNGAYLDSLGWVYFKMGNYDLAEENLRKASEHLGNDATIQDHLGDLYHKTGRLKLAANHWEHALDEWNKSLPGDVDPGDVSKTQKKLEGVKVKLAQQSGGVKQ